MKAYSDEELYELSDDEMEMLILETIIEMICTRYLAQVAEEASCGAIPPDEETEVSSFGDYERFAQRLETLLKPSYHAMMYRIHAQVYQNLAVEGLGQ